MTEAFVAKPSGIARETDYIAAVERIRELEAELRFAESKIWAMIEVPPELQYKARAEKAEARVAELKAKLDLFDYASILPHIHSMLGCEACEAWVEAREREAE